MNGSSEFFKVEGGPGHSLAGPPLPLRTEEGRRLSRSCVVGAHGHREAAGVWSLHP